MLLTNPKISEEVALKHLITVDDRTFSSSADFLGAGYRNLETKLSARERSVKFVVRSDPEPDDLFSFAYTYSTIGTCYTDRPETRIVGQPLKPQTRVSGVLTEKAIGFSGFFLNLSRKFTVAVPEARVSSAVQSFFGSRGAVLPAR